jgi:hypothetical protein
MTLTIEPLAPIGALIHGATADVLLHDPDVERAVMEALEANGVLVFPEIGLDDQEQIAFAGRLGEIAGGRSGRSRDFPEIYLVGFGPDLNDELYVKGSFFWHIDGTTDAQPSKASLLSGRRLAAEAATPSCQHVSGLRPAEPRRPTALRRAEGGAQRRSGLPLVRAQPHRRDGGALAHHAHARAPAGVDPPQRPQIAGARHHGRPGGGHVGRGECIRATCAAATRTRSTHRWKVGDLRCGTTAPCTPPRTPDSGRMMHVTLVGDEPIQDFGAR